MPIKGLTDNVIPRYPNLGKLRKGGERPESGKAPGKDLTYFRFTGTNANVQAAFDEAYGKEPALLHVYLTYQSPDDNFQTWKEAWVASGLSHRCDGETCTIWLTDKNTYSREPKPCPGGCDEVGRLEVILPELIKAGHVGYVTLETHGNHDLRNILGALVAVYNASNDLRGIEFILRRRPVAISTPSGRDGARARREKWLVFIEPSPTWVQMQLQMAHQAQLPELPASQYMILDQETGEIIDAESNDQIGHVLDGDKPEYRAESPTKPLTQDQIAHEPLANCRDAYAPAELVAELRRMAGEFEDSGMTGTIATDTAKHIAAAMNRLAHGKEEIRRVILQTIFGVEIDSATKLSRGQAEALTTWMDMGDNDWQANNPVCQQDMDNLAEFIRAENDKRKAEQGTGK